MGLGRAAIALAVAALALAGCGGGSSPHTADETSPCLRELGYTVQRATLANNLIAATAANGGLIARGNGNTLTIAFGANPRDALRLARAYRRGAPRRLRELIQPKRNAVLIWTVAPSFEQMETAEKCLS